jgi:hypothetical protein
MVIIVATAMVDCPEYLVLNPIGRRDPGRPGDRREVGRG